eukprot:gene4149-4441_t
MLRSFRPQFDSLYLSPDLYFQANSFQQEIIRLFSPPSDYAFGLHLRKEAYDPTKRMEDREPIAAPWQHAAITDYLQAVTSGNPPAGNPKSTENDGFCSVIPLIARFAVAKAEGKLSSLSQADDVILGAAKLLSSNITALAHTYVTARMLFSIIERGEALKTSEQIFNAIDEDLPDYLSDAVEDIKQNILVVEQSLKKDVTTETARFGKACGNPGSFMGALLAVLQSTNSVVSDASQYISAIRKIIRAGGCNCSRANIAGALLGATYGVHGDNENTYVDPLHANLYRSNGGIPITWMLQCDDIETIIDMAVMAAFDLLEAGKVAQSKNKDHRGTKIRTIRLGPSVITAEHLCERGSGQKKHNFEISHQLKRKVFIRKIEDIRLLTPYEDYGIPVIPNFPLIDAVIGPNLFLQMTVSYSHEGACHAKYNREKCLLQALKYDVDITDIVHIGGMTEKEFIESFVMTNIFRPTTVGN